MPSTLFRKTDSWIKLADLLDHRTPFKNSNGTFRGATEAADGWYATGRLPQEYRESFLAVLPLIDYVIYSYGTPIAWHTPTAAGWQVPDARYSVTTTQHQNRVRVAIENGI